MNFPAPRGGVLHAQIAKPPPFCDEFCVVFFYLVIQHGHRLKNEKYAMQIEDIVDVSHTKCSESSAMLKAVIEGETYESVAGRFGISRTAVERRIKSVATQLSKSVGIVGLNETSVNFVSRLRLHREAISVALQTFGPQSVGEDSEIHIVTIEEIERAVQRIKGRSRYPWHDIALFYVLFVTGARPLEIARLEVRDYLNADGTVRRESVMREEVTISGKARPLFFSSRKLDAVLDSYLQERVTKLGGYDSVAYYRNLDPMSRLFLSPTGEGFRITPYGKNGQRRFLCRAILETYAKLFRYSELEGVTAMSVRRTVISRLYDRGADEDQIGLLLGISERSAVRELLARPKRTLSTLVDELI